MSRCIPENDDEAQKKTAKQLYYTDFQRKNQDNKNRFQEELSEGIDICKITRNMLKYLRNRGFRFCYLSGAFPAFFSHDVSDALFLAAFPVSAVLPQYDLFPFFLLHGL